MRNLRLQRNIFFSTDECSHQPSPESKRQRRRKQRRRRRPLPTLRGGQIVQHHDDVIELATPAAGQQHSVKALPDAAATTTGATTTATAATSSLLGLLPVVREAGGERESKQDHQDLELAEDQAVEKRIEPMPPDDPHAQDHRPALCRVQLLRSQHVAPSATS